jgi:glycosyltransferase involved in cell wall biosynthesis
LPAGVQRTVIGPKPLGAGRVAAHLFNIRAIFCIRRHLRESRPKVVVSFITVTNIFVILASAGLKCRLVISERNDPTRQRAGPIWATLRRGLYRFADVVTANTAHAVEAMVDYVPRRKLVAVHNPVVLPGDIQSFKRSSVVLNVGRLVPQKNQRLIVEAIALLGIKSQDWRMELVGEGPDRDDLVGLAERKGLSGLVNMQGSVADPDPHYRAAGIFVLSSVYEGTPNVLLEAMAHAVPCIVSDSLPGALEYVEDGVSGLIFRSGDSTHLAECLLKLIENPDLRLSLGREGRKRVENYSVEIVSAQWNRLLFPLSDAGIRSDRTGAV